MLLRSPMRSIAAVVLVGLAFAAVQPVASSAEPVVGSIVVHAAGDRDLATGEPVPLAGALVRAYLDETLTTPAGECTTDATGACSIDGLAPGTYWVTPAGDPPGEQYRRIDAVTTSFGVHERYAEPVVVEEGTPESRTLAYVRANPPFPARCGVRVTLVYDLSGSISDAEAAAMKAASVEFVDALAGTPSAIAIASFATAAPAHGNTNLVPTRVDDAAGVATVKAAIDALSRPTGDDRYTNWDAALRAVAGQSDVVVLFTDGNPTVFGVPAVFPPVHTALDQIDHGVFSANAVKRAGARVLAVGVGDLADLSAENLAVVSGPVEGSDYAITTFADVRRVFHELADALCPRPESPPEPTPLPITPRFTG